MAADHRLNIVLQLRTALCCNPVTEYKRDYSIKANLQQSFVNNCSDWKIFSTSSCFNRRITAIEWHPTYHNMVTFASHGGDVYLWDYNNHNNDNNVFMSGEGIGYGCITEILYDGIHPMIVYCSSVNGTVTKKDLAGKHSNILIDTMNIKYWWTSLAYCNSRHVLFTGGNTGKAVVMDTDGNKIKEYNKFHKGKIQHAEFSPTDDNLLVTSSNDKTVCIWDIRYLNDSPRPLAVMIHDAPVNSGCFDPIYGCRLLTTSQNSIIRVYESFNNWDKPSLSIEHPHRNFQHMTKIKATWHPLFNDICIVGRYPGGSDIDQTRCVDIINVYRKEIVGKLIDKSLSQIMVLNKFNKTGNILATGMGYTAVLWKIQQHNEYMKQGRSVTMVTKQVTSTGIDRTRKRKRKEETDICKKKRKQ